VNATCVMEELATRSGVDVLNKSRNREKTYVTKRESTRKWQILYQDTKMSIKARRVNVRYRV